MLRRVMQAFAAGASSMRRSWRSTSLSVAAIVGAVFVLGVFLTLSRAVDEALARWGQAAEVSVFLDERASDTIRADVERTLRGAAVVGNVRLVSMEEASARFSQSFPDLAPLVAADSDTRLPPSFEARLRPGADVGLVVALADRLRGLPGVADVRVDQELLTGILNVARVGRLVGTGLATILIFAAALAIASVVRLSYVARRDEVEVLYLLGAPVGVIRAPFVAEGALQGALGAGLALALLALAQYLFVRQFADVLGDFRVAQLPWWLLMIVLGAAFVVGSLAGFLAVREQRADARTD